MKKNMKLPITKHFRRFEVKYLVSEEYVDRIIPLVLEQMQWDDYAKAKGYYTCQTLYTDSLDLSAYKSVVNGDLFRKKLRFRLYQKDGLTGFLEMKRKKNRVIIKDRERLSVLDFQKFLKNPFSLQSQKWDDDFTQEVIAYHLQHKISTKCWVLCHRKAFVHRFNRHFRITFDYHLKFSKINDDGFFPLDMRKYYEKWVVMEVKFTEKMPLWFKNIIDTYKLSSSGFSKYAVAIDFLRAKTND